MATTTKAPEFKLQKVQSSNISELGWLNNQLRVRFASGGLFSYDGVTQQQYDELIKAKSIGSHFAKYIRPKFVGVKI